MPVKRRVARLRRQTTWTEYHKWQLKLQFDYFDNAFGNGDRFNEEAARQCWEDLKAEIMVEWIAENPLSRPWAFWEFETLPPRLDENESDADYLRRNELLTAEEKQHDAK